MQSGATGEERTAPQAAVRRCRSRSTRAAPKSGRGGARWFRNRLAKLMAHDCFRNTKLEDFHSGKYLSSKTGDHCDVKVVSPFGEIPWKELSRLSDEEMKILMIDAVNQYYKFLSELLVSARERQSSRR